MAYDAERRLAHWQSSPSNPTSSADDLYDGSGSGHAPSRMARAVRIWDSAVG